VTIKKGKLRWAGHATRSQNFLLRTVLEQNPVGKISKLRWEDTVNTQKGCRIIRRRIKHWEVLAVDIYGWRIGCDTAWSQTLPHPKKKPFLII